MEPDFDFDDLINDDIEDSFGGPPPEEEYNEDFLEEMGIENGGVDSTDENKNGNRNNDSSANTNTTGTDAGSTVIVTNDAIHVPFDPPAETAEVNAREALAPKKKNDIYSFQRYNASAQWRSSSAINSPNAMKAKDWKSLQSRESAATTVKPSSLQWEDAKAGLLGTTKGSQNQRASVAPAAQLLDYFSRFSACNNTTIANGRGGSSAQHHKLKGCSRRMPSKPVEGQRSFPMTFGDGSRCYVRMKNKATEAALSAKSTSVSSGSNSDYHHNDTLGISMPELLRRVQAIRRNKDHAKQLQQRDLELEEAATAEEDNDDDNNDNLDKEKMEKELFEKKKRHRQQQDMDSKLWVDKHAPCSFTHLLSEERTNREVVRALRGWDPYVFHRDPPARPDWGGTFRTGSNNNTSPSKHPKSGDDKPMDSAKKVATKNSKDRRPDESSRVILLSGPPGVGKTTLAHIIAQHVGYRPIEVNGSDERSASVLTERVVRAMESNTLNMNSASSSPSQSGSGDGERTAATTASGSSRTKPNCLILDEIDGADAKGAIQSLVEIIRADIPSKGARGNNKTPYLRRPIIFICNNKFAPALRPLLPYARQFEVTAPSSNRLVARLRSVLQSEHVPVFGGSSLLHQLVTATSGDIRSCLYTLQFASSRARESARANSNGTDGVASGSGRCGGSGNVDLTQALHSALNGDGMKDERNDMVGTMTAIFRKEKNSKHGKQLLGGNTGKKGRGRRQSSVERVLDKVMSFGDNSRILDAMFLNNLHVSYIDPTFDKCAAVLECLSSSDMYRSHNNSLTSNNEHYALEFFHIPPAAAAVHLLCRVEQRPDLTFSTRKFGDTRYKKEANLSLTQKFVEGISPHARGCRSANLVATETIPYSMWMLSSGEGHSALDRQASSLDMLKKGERASFNNHVATLRALGLTYITTKEGTKNDKRFISSARTVTLEPPIEQLINFVDLTFPGGQRRLEIPPGMKELLAQAATLEKIRNRKESQVLIPTPSTQQQTEVVVPMKSDSAKEQLCEKPAPSEKVANAAPLALTKRNLDASSTPPSKRPKPSLTAQNFLGVGAKKAKAARSARNAARVGVELTKKCKVSHTGSGVLLSQVIRLKYVKGFTQAVRTPCRLEELT